MLAEVLFKTAVLHWMSNGSDKLGPFRVVITGAVVVVVVAVTGGGGGTKTGSPKASTAIGVFLGGETGTVSSSRS